MLPERTAMTSFTVPISADEMYLMLSRSKWNMKIPSLKSCASHSHRLMTLCGWQWLDSSSSQAIQMCWRHTNPWRWFTGFIIAKTDSQNADDFDQDESILTRALTGVYYAIVGSDFDTIQVTSALHGWPWRYTSGGPVHNPGTTGARTVNIVLVFFILVVLASYTGQHRCFFLCTYLLWILLWYVANLASILVMSKASKPTIGSVEETIAATYTTCVTDTRIKPLWQNVSSCNVERRPLRHWSQKSTCRQLWGLCSEHAVPPQAPFKLLSNAWMPTGNGWRAKHIRIAMCQDCIRYITQSGL